MKNQLTLSHCDVKLNSDKSFICLTDSILSDKIRFIYIHSRFQLKSQWQW